MGAGMGDLLWMFNISRPWRLIELNTVSKIASRRLAENSRSFSGQQAEAAVGVAVLNRMLDAGRPNSVRRLNIAA